MITKCWPWRSRSWTPCTPPCRSERGSGRARTAAARHAGSHRRSAMKWVTRMGAKTDRVACPWLIKKFIDPAAEFLFVPEAEVLQVAGREGGKSFDCPGAD